MSLIMEGDNETTTVPIPTADDKQTEKEQTITSAVEASVVHADTERNDGHATAAPARELSSSSSSSCLSQEEERNRALRSQLALIRTQRQRLASLRAEKTTIESSQMLQTINAQQHEQEGALQDFLSVVSQRRRLERIWNTSRQFWNGLNDCFHIRHQGPFATINGLRLGSEANVVPSSSGPVENVAALVASNVATAATNGTDHNMSNGTVSSSPAGTVVTRVPWSEINAALGLLALLLSSLEQKPHCGIRYRHEIHCSGSTSKMGYRASPTHSAAAPTMYNLYSDDSFSFFGRRNFNTALHCLVQCVVDAADAIQQRDPTITLPHVIENKNHNLAPSRWEFLVGGLPVAFGTDGVEWTRAMKYLLTNVKTLLVFRPFGLWDPAAESSRRLSMTT